MHQLISAGAKDRPKDRIESRQWPILGKRRRNFGIETITVVGRAADDVGEQIWIGLAQSIAFDLLTKSVPDELANDRLRIGLVIGLELIESLDCRQPGHTALAVAAARAP